jgi:hypothetical protein
MSCLGTFTESREDEQTAGDSACFAGRLWRGWNELLRPLCEVVALSEAQMQVVASCKAPAPSESVEVEMQVVEATQCNTAQY